MLGKAAIFGIKRQSFQEWAWSLVSTFPRAAMNRYWAVMCQQVIRKIDPQPESREVDKAELHPQGGAAITSFAGCFKCSPRRASAGAARVGTCDASVAGWISEGFCKSNGCVCN